MTIGYDSSKSLSENTESLRAMLSVAKSGVDDKFTLRSVLVQPSGMLPEINGVVSEVTAFGTEQEVESELGTDVFFEIATHFGEGYTTITKEFRGAEAGEIAVQYANFMIEALKVS